MADDILGHENLDHGKHLKHHAHKPEPGERFGRGARPRHIGLGGAKKHKLGQGHGHDHASHQAHNAHTGATHAHPPARTARFDARTALPWIVGTTLGLIVAIALGQAFPAFIALILILVINTVLEYHKYFTEGVPLDLEILYIGSAYLGAVHGILWGVILAAIGPFVADIARGHTHNTTAFKSIAVFVTAATASILNPTGAELVFAILLGNATQYVILLSAGRTSGLMSILRRISTFGFNAYLALFIVPYFL